MKRKEPVKWKKDPQGNKYFVGMSPDITVVYESIAIKSKLPVIPLKNLNCLHCKLYSNECTDQVRLYAATGKPCLPEDYYCFRISKNYSEEKVENK